MWPKVIWALCGLSSQCNTYIWVEYGKTCHRFVGHQKDVIHYDEVGLVCAKNVLAILCWKDFCDHLRRMRIWHLAYPIQSPPPNLFIPFNTFPPRCVYWMNLGLYFVKKWQVNVRLPWCICRWTCTNLHMVGNPTAHYLQCWTMGRNAFTHRWLAKLL